MDLRHLTDDELVTNTIFEVKDETNQTIRVLHHLKEVERRRVYAKRGQPSIWAFAIKVLGYSESAAGRRISAMRLMRDLPEVENKIREGSLNLTTAAQAKVFANKSKKSVRETVAAVENKSSRDAMNSLFELALEMKPKKNEQLEKNIERLRELLSHVPNLNDEAILLRATEELLNKIDPQRKAPSARESKLEKERTVFRRDRCCTYVDEQTGQRCGSRYLLQIDHIVPKVLGGSDDLSNLRVLCAEHNRLEAIRKLGNETMAPFIRM